MASLPLCIVGVLKFSLGKVPDPGADLCRETGVMTGVLCSSLANLVLGVLGTREKSSKTNTNHSVSFLTLFKKRNQIERSRRQSCKIQILQGLAKEITRNNKSEPLYENVFKKLLDMDALILV